MEPGGIGRGPRGPGTFIGTAPSRPGEATQPGTRSGHAGKGEAAPAGPSPDGGRGIVPKNPLETGAGPRPEGGKDGARVGKNPLEGRFGQDGLDTGKSANGAGRPTVPKSAPTENGPRPGGEDSGAGSPFEGQEGRASTGGTGRPTLPRGGTEQPRGTEQRTSTTPQPTPPQPTPPQPTRTPERTGPETAAPGELWIPKEDMEKLEQQARKSSGTGRPVLQKDAPGKDRMQDGLTQGRESRAPQGTERPVTQRERVGEDGMQDAPTPGGENRATKGAERPVNQREGAGEDGLQDAPPAPGRDTRATKGAERPVSPREGAGEDGLQDAPTPGRDTRATKGAERPVNPPEGAGEDGMQDAPPAPGRENRATNGTGRPGFPPQEGAVEDPQEPALPGQEGKGTNGTGKPVLRKGGGEDGMMQDPATAREGRGTNGAGRPVPQKGMPEGKAGPGELPQAPTRKGADGFAPPTAPGGKAPAQGPANGPPVTPLKELLPTFEKSPSLETVAKRFATDMKMLGSQVRPSQLSVGERALRMWAFFTAYAEAAAQSPKTPEGKEAFRKALQEHGFGQLRDAKTGKDGVETAMAMLEAESPEQLQELAQHVDIQPGPEMKKEAARAPTQEIPKAEEPPRKEQKDSRFEATSDKRTTNKEQAARERLAPEVEGKSSRSENPKDLQALPPGLQRKQFEDELERLKKERKGTDKKLGAHMLWNVLHKFRDDPEQSAVEREKWDQAAFAAMMALVGLGLMVAILASL